MHMHMHQTIEGVHANPARAPAPATLEEQVQLHPSGRGLIRGNSKCRDGWRHSSDYSGRGSGMAAAKGVDRRVILPPTLGGRVRVPGAYQL